MTIFGFYDWAKRKTRDPKDFFIGDERTFHKSSLSLHNLIYDYVIATTLQRRWYLNIWDFIIDEYVICNCQL